ncbi:DUF5047 domain-containing protein [Brevibacterium sp. ZH18]|uniref:DUF5047 domain-containing protein n=1 Tax=Brevibacterium sp. ZH18 TaxID=2927784 RepID=UPI001F62509A|nr:DUF5047 domain-containing protein [Brevibacterium sp. ZH18]MCI4013021.1 DUF5047 domain-containing protein [Brevibacterium sp. ZH18]
MFPVSDRWLESLSLARYEPVVQWSPDRGNTWLDLTVHDGSISAASTSQVRWSARGIIVSGAEIGRRALSPYGSRVRVFMRMHYDRGNYEQVPLGVYRVEEVSQQGLRPGRAALDGLSLEAQVQDERFTSPRSLAIGPGQYWVERLIKEVLPEVSLSWRLDDILIPELVEERDRWGLIDGRSRDPSIAKSLGGRVFCDSRGSFVAAPVPTLEDTPAWALAAGPGGALVEPQQTLSRDGVYNQIVAQGATENGKPPVGPAIASDDDPISPTYYKGPFGAVPLFYTSKMLTTFQQCQKAALSLLAPRLGLKQTVSVSALVNYAIEPDDIITVTMPDETVENHIVDSVSFPLTGGAMNLQTRSTSSPAGGRITVEASEDDYGDGEGSYE